jgi:hypothetical protein
MTVVTLTEDEIRRAAAVGVERRVQSMAAGLKDRDFGLEVKSRRWDIDIEGAAAELAYCKAMGREWDETVNTFHDADVGGTIQIRFTTVTRGSLIIRPSDPPEHYYVLVIGPAPKYIIPGWIKGTDARRDDWERRPNDGPMAWFVPQFELKALAGKTT